MAPTTTTRVRIVLTIITFLAVQSTIVTSDPSTHDTHVTTNYVYNVSENTENKSTFSENQSYNSTKASRVTSDNTTEYEKIRKLYKDVLHRDRYNPQIRPLQVQNKRVRIAIKLKLIELVSIDDVAQKMTTRCFISMNWRDELITWDEEQYHVDDLLLMPKINDVWRPVVALFNGLEKKKSLGIGDKTPPVVQSSGNISWHFDTLFTTSCNLDVDKYPFDTQECHIEIQSTVFDSKYLEFTVPDPRMDTHLTAINYGWTILETKAEVDYLNVTPRLIPLARFTLKVKRKSTFYMLHDIAPTVILSFLNCFVFFVPVDSGEKISFSVSVLLSIAVFLSITNTKLSYATDGVPAINKYLGCLFASSVLCVTFSIIIVWLHQVVKKRQQIKDQRSIPSRMTSPNATASRSYDNNIIIIKKRSTRGEQFCKDGDDENSEKESHPTMDTARCDQSDHVMIKADDNSILTTVLESVLQYSEIVGFVIILGWTSGVTVWFSLYVNCCQ